MRLFVEYICKVIYFLRTTFKLRLICFHPRKILIYRFSFKIHASQGLEERTLRTEYLYGKYKNIEK